MHRLITIPFSHYNEKARWALERYGFAYREVPCLPGFHALPVALATWRSGGAQADPVSSRYSTPILIPAGEAPICDSSAILQWVAERSDMARRELFPNRLAAEYEASISRELGPLARQVAYSWVLDRPDLMHEMVRHNAGPAQRRLYAMAWPFVRERLRSTFRIDADSLRLSIAAIRAIVEGASRQLEWRTFLNGPSFSAADLSFACMLAPVLWVRREEGFGAWLPEPERLPPDAQELRGKLRATRAGRHALEMFARWRGRHPETP